MLTLPFDFIGTRHPFLEVVGRLRARIAAHRLETAGLAQAPHQTTVHTEIKARRAGGEHWVIDRFYWSAQWPEVTQPLGTRAATLSYDGKTARSAWHTFPSDPYLTFLEDYAGKGGVGERARLLRYVPLRRVTFRADDPVDGIRIGKFKRRSRFREAYHKLRVVADATARTAAPFKVAKPLRLIEQQALYYQSALAGADVAELITPTTGPALLSRIGEIHRQLHSLDVPNLPVVSNLAWLTKAIEDLDLIGLYMPEACERLSHLPALLQGTAPTDQGFTFCHGDFVCSQLLLAGEQWSVTDFDLACTADPYRDVAIFLASLAYDVAALARAQSPEAESELTHAYVDGYFGAASKADGQRLHWHRVSAEIYYMALMLKKDRYSETQFQRRLVSTLELADRLAHA